MPSDMERYFPSRFLVGEGVDQPTKLTVQSVKEEQIGKPGEEELKLVVHWAEDAKPLVLNKTNFKSIEEVAGSGSIDKWAGTVVEIYTIHGEWFGKEQDAIRIRKPTKKSVKKEAS